MLPLRKRDIVKNRRAIENIYTFYCSVCAALSLWSQSYARQIRIKCINISEV